MTRGRPSKGLVKEVEKRRRRRRMDPTRRDGTPRLSRSASWDEHLGSAHLDDAHVTRTANGGRAYDFKLWPVQGVRRALSPCKSGLPTYPILRSLQRYLVAAPVSSPPTGRKKVRRNVPPLPVVWVCVVIVVVAISRHQGRPVLHSIHTT
ncbi:hypothetical protein LX32DRAFT_162530 [Colletotrichum zoysiae]|uniref:Uncharacterized protein n=1 Tax=Colletotrichum zoysiae TaxID=1216348 RepID=A0AAD9LWE2_9PEZI|nr:hypothetical protein LX32DRAFT_162530 [Colletotrichum zoysiae]